MSFTLPCPFQLPSFIPGFLSKGKSLPPKKPEEPKKVFKTLGLIFFTGEKYTYVVFGPNGPEGVHEGSPLEFRDPTTVFSTDSRIIACHDKLTFGAVRTQAGENWVTRQILSAACEGYSILVYPDTKNCKTPKSPFPAAEEDIRRILLNWADPSSHDDLLTVDYTKPRISFD
jgi:hypothetical protein